MIALRKARVCLRAGEYRPVAAKADLLLFVRQQADERLLVALNMGAEPAQAAFPGPVSGCLLLSTLGDRQGEAVRGALDLRANEGAIVELTSESVLAQGQLAACAPSDGPAVIVGLGR